MHERWGKDQGARPKTDLGAMQTATSRTAAGATPAFRPIGLVWRRNQLAPPPRLAQLARVIGSRCGLFPACCLSVMLAGASVVHAADPERASDAGLAIIETPDVGRAFVSGPVTAFAHSADGVLFVGSHRLAAFDGAVWRAIAVPDASRVLALAHSPVGAGQAAQSGASGKMSALPPEPERIWVGASGTIGCLEKDGSGQWIFRSFKAQLAAAKLGEIDEVRYVHPAGRGAVFVARSRILRWDGETMTAWDLPSATRLYAFADGDTLMVYQSGVGLLRLEANGPKLWLPESTLPARPPMVGYLTLAGGIRLAVFNDAVYRHRADGWMRLEEVSNVLSGKRAIRALPQADGALVIGTTYGGVVLTKADGKLLGVTNSQSGLPDDCVNTMWADGAGQLWVGMNRGLTRLVGVGALSLFDQRVGLATRDIKEVISHDGRPIVITGQSVYALVPATVSAVAHFSRVETYWTFLRDGVVVDGQLWLGDSSGLWRVSAGKGVREPQFAAEVFLLFKPRALSRGFLFFESSECMAWLSDERGGAAVSLHQNLDSAPVSAVEDRSGTIFVSTINGQIHAFVWNESERRLERVARYVQGQGLPVVGTRPVLSTVDGAVLAFTDRGILALGRERKEFKPAAEFADFIAVAAAPSARGGAYWVVQHKELGEAGPKALLWVERDTAENRFRWRALHAPGLDQAGDVSSANLTTERGADVLWIGGANAVLRLETTQLRPAEAVPEVFLRAVQLGASDLAPVAAGARANFPSSVKRMEFVFAVGAALTTDSAFSYQTRLEGIEREWSSPHNTPDREFTGLPAGQYAFTVRAVDRFGRPGPPLRYNFAVEAAWYRRPWTFALDAAIAALLVWAVVRWRVHQLQRQTERLNRLVNDRTRELSLSNTAKSEFLENISHEIRNPLNGIVGLINLLEEKSLSGPEREHAQALKECSENLTRVFNEVLNFSKLEYGYVTLEERAFQLAGLLDSVRNLFSGPAAQQGSTIAARFPSGFADGFWGDDGKIKTIVGNFVGNALKYAPGTPVELVVTIDEAAEGKAEVLIEVIDRGPGVPPEEQELIFKKFVRGSNRQIVQAPGAGIGLATCRLLAKLLGGSVGIESPAPVHTANGEPADGSRETGPGSLFFLKLTLARHEAAKDLAVDAPSTDTIGDWALIVEDQHYNQVVLAGVVSKIGFNPECARDAGEAFAAIGRKTFAVVFLDVELPQMKGPEIARRLRVLPQGQHFIIIGTSASDSDEAAQRCLAAGMDAFLLKPLTAAGIQAALTKVRGNRQHRNGASPVIDFSALELYAQSAGGGMTGAVHTYVSALKGELAGLRDATDRQAVADVVLAAHRVRSHATLINASGLAQAAGDFEKMARAGNLAGSAVQLEKILAEAEVVKQRLTAGL